MTEDIRIGKNAGRVQASDIMVYALCMLVTMSYSAVAYFSGDPLLMCHTWVFGCLSIYWCARCTVNTSASRWLLGVTCLRVVAVMCCLSDQTQE